MKAGFLWHDRDNDKMKNDKRRAQGESEAGDFVWIICGGGLPLEHCGGDCGGASR